MDFKEMLEKRAENLKIDLTNIDRAYRDFDKQEELKWAEFLKSPFIEGANFENNNFSYLSTHISEYEEQLKEEYGKVIAAGGKELEDFNKKTQSFIAAKSKLEEAKAKRITFEKIETERKIASAKAIFKAVADMKKIVDEQIKIINEQITKTYKELQGVSYTDSKYQELNDKISELMKVQKPFFNHAKLLDAIEKSREMLDTTFVRSFKVGKDYNKMYDEIAIKSSELRAFRNDELTLNLENFEKKDEFVEIKEESELTAKPDVKEEKTNGEYLIEVEEAVKLKEEKIVKQPEAEKIEVEKIEVEKIEDEEIIDDEVLETKNEMVEEAVVKPKNVKNKSMLAKKAIAVVLGTSVAGLSNNLLVVGPIGTFVVAGAGKIIVKRSIKKNEERENRLHEIEDDLLVEYESYNNSSDEMLAEEFSEIEQDQQLKNVSDDVMTEEEKRKFEDLNREAQELRERLNPNLKDEKYKGPAKVKSFADAKDKLKAKVAKLKAYIGSKEGLELVNTFLNSVIISEVGFCVNSDLISLINLNNTNTPVTGIAGKILDNPDAVHFLEKVDRIRM